MSPFVRNLLIIAGVAAAIVALNAETALSTAQLLVSFVFFIAIAVVLYFFWRDIGRHEIATWSSRSAGVFYAACGLLLVDLGWWLIKAPQGRNALVSIVVAAISGYVAVRTWLEQKRYS